jgi:hypothetical protein
VREAGFRGPGLGRVQGVQVLAMFRVEGTAGLWGPGLRVHGFRLWACAGFRGGEHLMAKEHQVRVPRVPK